MARIISTSVEFSGKLNGWVFARNKGGLYARAYTIPLNPRTQGQLQVRNGWAAAVTAWHALTEAEKAEWNLFAATDFKPKYPRIGVTYSGFNTFVSCRNELIQATRVQANPTITNTTATFTPFNPIIRNAPALPLSANITMGQPGSNPGGTITKIQLVRAELDTNDWSLALIFKFDANLSSSNVPIFRDAIGNVKCGIIVMGSYPSPQKNTFTINPKYSFACVIPHPQISATTVTSNELEFTTTFFRGTKKFIPVAGDVIELNAFLVGMNGLTQPIGSVKVIAS